MVPDGTANGSPVEVKPAFKHELAAVRSPSRPPLAATSVYRKPSVGRWRFLRAYSTTFQVIGSYLWIIYKHRFLRRAIPLEDWNRIHRVNASRVYQTILVLQGLFIKVGQLLSILANFLPEPFRKELEGLQDQVPPRPFAEVASRLESDLGADYRRQFLSFNEVPIASASLGQVHEARLLDGTRVVVKVQHRDIDDIVRLDTRTIRRILQIVQWFVPLQGLEGYYHQIKELLNQELDFEREAASIETISKNFSKDSRIVFPTPIAHLSTKRVLTTTFVDGRKVGDLKSLEALGLDRKDLAQRLVRAYCQMIFVDGVYHADPHPGNILVQKDGALVLLDFGAVAVLSSSMREGIAEFLESVLRRDTSGLVGAMRKMGFLSKTSEEEVGEKVIEYFHRRFQEEIKLETFNLKDIKVDPQRGLENLLDLRRMNIGLKELSSAFVIPKDWILLERTLLLLYGTCSLLDPELNPLTVIQPYLKEFVLGNRDWTQLAVATVRDMAMGAVTLPEDLRRYLNKAVRGEIVVRVGGIHEGAQTVYTAVRQLIYTAIALTAGYVSLQCRWHGDAPMAEASGTVAALAGTFLLYSSIFSRPRPSRYR